jgi:hypothetical protein
LLRRLAEVFFARECDQEFEFVDHEAARRRFPVL